MQVSGRRYLDYASFVQNTFGQRVQKISLDTGFTCPNRDGSKGLGGCTYCNNNSFNPDYCEPSTSIEDQLQEGITRFDKRYSSQKYLAYFQAYTNTYSDIDTLKRMYQEALAQPRIVGLVIGTRPDCINEEIVTYLSELAKTHYVSLEFGVESTSNKTLKTVNRCHTFEETQAAYELCKNRGFHLGAHLILGLPGESREEMLNHAFKVSELNIHSLKLHHLQIVKGSIMAHQFKKNPDSFRLFQADDYIDFIADFVGLLRPEIIIERFSSQASYDLLIAPKWNGLKNFEIADKINKRLAEKNSWQGKYYQSELR